MKQYEQVTKYKKVFKESTKNNKRSFKEEVDIVEIKRKLEDLNFSFLNDISSLMSWFDDEAAGFSADPPKDLRLIIQNFDKVSDILSKNEKLIENLK